jgi:hypothetical protein
MALKPCPECGKEVSESAYECPHCGHALRENIAQAMMRFQVYRGGIAIILMGVAGLVAVIWKAVSALLH